MLLFLVQVTRPPATKDTSRRVIRRVDLHLLNTVGGRGPPCLFWALTLLRDAASDSGANVNTLNITTSSPQETQLADDELSQHFSPADVFILVS